MLTSPGLDNIANMSRAVTNFRWPPSIVNMPDETGDLWSHFGVRFRGTWVLINERGEVVRRTSPHPPDLFRQLDTLLSAEGGSASAAR